MIKRLGLLMLIVIAGVFTPFFAQAVLSNDPFVEQWGYQDTGVYNAWQKSTGSKRVVVAIVDNGFDNLHPDLLGNIWRNVNEIPNNNIDDDKNGYVDDVSGWNFVPEDSDGDGVINENEKKGNNNPRPKVTNLTDLQKSDNIYSHATAVAGLIGAVGNNSRDGAGVNWKVSLMNLRVLGNSGAGEQIYVAPAIKYAVDNGADIINISLVAGEDDEIKQAVEYARQKGVVVVAAAGNDTADLNIDHVLPVCADYGNSVQGVLGVSAIDDGHRMARFSNSGSECVDITAPGTNINTLGYFLEGNGNNPEYVRGWFGTSFSAPFVSGAAALIKSVEPDWKAPEIYQALLATVHKTPPSDPEEYKNLFGSGLLQVDQAVEYAISHATPDTLLKTNKKFVIFSPVDGQVTERDISREKEGNYGFDTLKNTNRIFLGNTKEGMIWIVEKKQSNSQSVIEVYDSGWNKKNTWTLSTLGVSAMNVGDADGDGNDDLVTLQNTKSKNNFKVYNLDGTLLNTFSDKAIPRVGFLGFVSNDVNNSKDIVVLNSERDRQIIYRFANGKLMGTLSLFDINNVVDFQAVDIDGDGIEEYVILGDNHGQSTLAIYQKNGTLSIAFPLGQYQTKDIRFHVYDYDDDGRRDIIIYPLSSNGVLSAWSNSGDKLMEWTVPTEASSTPQSIKILPLP